MTTIMIYDDNGLVVNTIDINDVLSYVDGRVSKGNKYYYKGAGVPYTSHWIDNIEDDSLYSKVTKSDIFYMGHEVVKKAYVNKFGIFQEAYQPFFTDHIGACGVKEFSIIENSMFFERSSVRVDSSVNFDTINNQYYFKVVYKCGRKKYIEHGGSPMRLLSLIYYMLHTNWNFNWDKDTITDISYDGLVSDVGDMYASKELKAKVGTVYSILHSLSKRIKPYYEFLVFMKSDTVDCLVNTIKILKACNIDITELQPFHDHEKDMKHLVYNYLINGRNCGDCCAIDVGDNVRKGYVEQTISQIGQR